MNETTIDPTGEVHPAAALFPTLPSDAEGILIRSMGADAVESR